MPCLLKSKTAVSPGIISFTSNEYHYGVIPRSKRIRAYLEETSRRGEWVYGTHINGDFSYLREWPLTPWQSFVMWPNADASYLSNVPKNKLITLASINFLPDQPDPDVKNSRPYDICIISRATKIKRIHETMQIVRGLMNKKPDLRVVFIIPDQRDYGIGERNYVNSDIDRRFFELPLKIFSSKELKNISFLCPSSKSFGSFPISTQVIMDILRKSKFLLLTSHLEGTPRVVVEAFQAGTACIISKHLKCGIHEHINASNTLKIDDDVPISVSQILDALDKPWAVDTGKIRAAFSDNSNIPVLKSRLSQLLIDKKLAVDGEWFLEDLHLRLPGHGQKHSSQVMYNDEVFFRWLELVQKEDPYDDDKTIGATGVRDYDPFAKYSDFMNLNMGRARRVVKRLALKIKK